MEESISTSITEPLVILSQGGFSSDFIIGIFALLVLLACSAIISGSEAAFFSLSPAEKDCIKNDESKKGKTAQGLINKPQELLATILITNNFVNVGIVILSSSLMGQILDDSISESIRLFIEVVGITLTLLLLGEVIPKIYATKNALRFATSMAGTLKTLNDLPPISWIKTFLVNGSNIIHKRSKRKGIKISSDELEQALALTKEDTTSMEEQKILEGIVKFGNTEVCQIMRSRMDVVAIESESTFQQVMSTILAGGYSRIPVFKDKFDNVIGILFIKDILPYLDQTENENFNWLQLIRKPFFIPENKKIDDLLKEFQVKKVHMAVVVDEYGGANGVCSLEDVLEEIVGDITDEFDIDEISFTKIDEDTYLFEGKTALMDVYKVFDIDGKEFEARKGNAETIGGFIVENAGRILRNNEYIDLESIRLIVASSDKRRIKQVKIVRQPEI